MPVIFIELIFQLGFLSNKVYILAYLLEKHILYEELFLAKTTSYL